MDSARKKLIAAMIPILEQESGLVWGPKSVGQIVDWSLGQDLEVFQIEDVDCLRQKLCELSCRYETVCEMQLETAEKLTAAQDEIMRLRKTVLCRLYHRWLLSRATLAKVLCWGVTMHRLSFDFSRKAVASATEQGDDCDV